MQNDSDLGAHLCSFHDEVSSHLEFAGDFLQPGRCNPGRRMMRIGLPYRLQEQTGFLDITKRGGKAGKEKFQHASEQLPASVSTLQSVLHSHAQMHGTVTSHVVTSHELYTTKTSLQIYTNTARLQ